MNLSALKAAEAPEIPYARRVSATEATHEACCRAVGETCPGRTEGRPVLIYINGRFLQQPVTGVQRYARELVKMWDRMLERGEIDPQRFTFRVLAPRGPIVVPDLGRIEVRQVGRLRGHLWTQLELPFFARNGLLFSPCNVHPLLSLGQLHGVVTVHDLAYAAYPAAYSRAFRLAYSLFVPAALGRSNAVVTVSKAEKANILGRYPGTTGRIHAVHHGAPHRGAAAPDATKPTAPLDGRPFLLWVGTLIPRKNPQGAIDAFLRVSRDTPLDLIVAGARHPGLVEAELRVPEEMRGRVHFLGQINDPARLRGLYETAVALIFPSFYESFGLPPLEAMHFGCPVVAADLPVLREICDDAALYADPHQSAEIANQIRRLMGETRLRAKLQELGIRRAALFTWEKCARETFAILARVLDQKQGTPRTPLA